MSAKKTNKKTQPSPKPVKPRGGISISSGRDTKINGDVIEGNKTVEHAQPTQDTEEKSKGKTLEQANKTPAQSAWANGLFYLLIFVVVVSVLGLLAGKLGSTQLGLIILAGLLAVPLIGALQLRMDKRLSEKNFIELIKITISQLPIVKNFFRGQR